MLDIKGMSISCSVIDFAPRADYLSCKTNLITALQWFA